MSRAVERIAARQVAAVRARLAGVLATAPGIYVEQGPRGIVVRARGLRARWLRDPGLRWLGRWLGGWS